MSTAERIQTPDEVTGELEVNQEESNIEQTKPQTEIPSKFKDKSVEDIVKSYTELEKQFGKQAQELGQQRKLTDQLVQKELNSQNTTSEAVSEEEEFEFDYDNPKESIRKLVQKELDPLKQSVTKTDVHLAQQQLQERHPDYVEVVQDEDFTQWVNSSSIRMDLYQRANNNHDLDAAVELLDTFKALHPKEDTATKEVAKQKQVKERVNEMTTESGSSGQTGTKTYKRSEIINLRATNPKEYWERAEEFRNAYAEGRVR